MKNIESMSTESRIAAVRKIRANFQVIVVCYRATVEQNPEDTCRAIIDAIGKSEAMIAVAELVNTVGEWDRRIYDNNRQWAAQMENSATPEELKSCDIYQPSEIHPAHINQIATAMRKIS